MTISELYASHIRRVQVGFIISGENLNPEKISDALGIESDVSANRGDPKIVYGKTIGLYKKGFWRVHTKGKVESKDINDHLNFLLAILLPRTDAILELAENGETYFDVLWESTYLYAGTGPLISKECLSGIGKLNASMGFDIYQIDDEQSEAK
ncbi:MAG TPA: DUF4279 domain-containing protein [Anaerolineales bacterium]|nr:DUF4279 domain-containing protein [Anaerolineales bacterium]HNK63007.1 DUF4279 domain-containing protein [Anaerolineales bacterium]HNO31114.1 DUF4279 domain-containing protein [Anaerolineales bacterium]